MKLLVTALATVINTPIDPVLLATLADIDKLPLISTTQITDFMGRKRNAPFGLLTGDRLDGLSH